jgi:predicted MPP superfamily phosphohydrolase
MKVYSKVINLSTNKDVKDTNIVCISDLHYSKKLNKKVLPYLYNEICSCHPDYICFLGDLLNDDSFEDVYNYITYLSYIAPVIMIDGNHDIKSFKVDDEEHINKHHILSNELKFLLSNIPNVYYLNENQSELFDGISFTGTDFYHHTHEDENIQFLRANEPDIDANDYNILLCHSPYIIKKDVFDKLPPVYKDFDAAFTGHIHNALMPAYIDQHIKGNLGLFTVDTGFFPTDYVGEKNIKLDDNKRLTRINVPALRTFNGDNIVAQAANKFYPPSLRLIKIKKN